MLSLWLRDWQVQGWGGAVFVVSIGASAVCLFVWFGEDGFGYLCAPGLKCFIFYHLIGKPYR